MVNWTIFSGSAEEWHAAKQTFPRSSLYLAFEWGEIKAREGWEVVRILARRENSQIVGLTQILYRRLPLKGVFAWCPGGVVGDLQTFEFSKIAKTLGFKFYYIRSSFHDPQLSVELLSQLGWLKSPVPISNNQCMQIDLQKGEEELLGAMSSNWRHNLKRFGKKNLEIQRWQSPLALELAQYYEKFERMKGLAPQHSLNSIEGVLEKFGDRLVILRVLDTQGELLALRGYIQDAGLALDWYAISTEAGRSHYASHGVLWELLRYAKASGVAIYDLSGVDPLKNTGVYNFKKGAGGVDVHFPGEYEKASLPFLSSIMNALIKRRFQGA